MTAPNHANLPGVPSSSLPMWRYDTLPPAVRHALQFAPYNLSIQPDVIDNISHDGGEIVAAIHEASAIMIRKAVMESYGLDHPQARIDYDGNT